MAVDRGLAVDAVRWNAPDTPRSPDQPHNGVRFSVFDAYVCISGQKAALTRRWGPH